VTPDLAFECLLVSKDPQVVYTLNHVLDNFSICTKVCLSPAKAVHELRSGSTDLVVIDWEEERSASELLHGIQAVDASRKKTIVAIAPVDRKIAGTHLVLTKPLTAESGTKSLKLVYIRMLQEHRRHARYAVLTPVIATIGRDRLVPVTITNIGDGGMGLSCKEPLTVGDLLSFRLLLPSARRAIYIEARILWTRDYNVAGCEFVRIPPVDLDIFHDWLKNRCQVKKPLVAV
jgi:hypothetical protein